VADTEGHDPEFEDVDLPLGEESPLAEPAEWNPSSGIMNEAQPAEPTEAAAPSQPGEVPAEPFAEIPAEALTATEPFADVPLETTEIAAEPLGAEEVHFAESPSAVGASGVDVPGMSAIGLGSSIIGAASPSAVGGESGVTPGVEEAIEAEPEEETAETGEETEGEPAEKVAKRPVWVPFAEAAGVVVVAAAIHLLSMQYTINGAWNGGYFILIALIPYVLWKTWQKWGWPEISAPYTAMLAISLAALLTAIYWLGLELARYQWDVKAKKGTGAAPVAQSAPANATTAACPAAIQLIVTADRFADGIEAPWTT
jgi:hypothetical protein